MKVSLFIPTLADKNGIKSDVLLSRKKAEDYLTSHYPDEVAEHDDVDEFFDAVNSGKYSYIEKMDINEIDMHLKTLIEVAQVEKNAVLKQKPYLFSIKETIDGFESITVQLSYTNDPVARAKEIILNERGSEPEDWDDEINGVSFNGGDLITCTKHQAITCAQAFLWEMTDKVQYLPVEGDENV